MTTYTEIDQRVRALAIRVADEIKAVKASVASITVGAASWLTLTNKPSTFPPNAHTQLAASITDFNAAVDARLPAPAAASTAVSPEAYGGVGFCKPMYGVVSVAGNTTVTKTVVPVLLPGERDHPLTAAMVGKAICLRAGGTLGAQGTLFFSSVVSVNVAAQTMVLAAAPTVSITDRAVVYVDDTTAVAAAIADGYLKKKAVLLDGEWMFGPQIIKEGQSIIGRSIGTSKCYLLPGSASVSKYMFKNNSAVDHYQTFENLYLNGLRDFQMTGTGATREDIILIQYNGSGDTPVIDVFNRYRNLNLTESGIGLQYSGKGESKFTDISVDKCTYGIDFNAFDNALTGCHATAYGVPWRLGSSTSSNRFVACKGYFGGYAPPSGAFGALEYCCWALNGASYNEFSACEGQESWGDVWVLLDAVENLFSSCRAADPGCVFGAHGMGANNAAASRAGWNVVGASRGNKWAACSSGARVHGTTNYGSHALRIQNTASDNTGDMTFEKDLTAFTAAVLDFSTTGLGNKLSLNGVRVDSGFVTPTASYTLVITDAESEVRMNVATTNNLTVPPNSAVAFPIGTRIDVAQAGAGLTTVVAGAGVTLLFKAGLGLKMGGQHAGATLRKSATDTWTLFGDISA